MHRVTVEQERVRGDGRDPEYTCLHYRCGDVALVYDHQSNEPAMLTFGVSAMYLPPLQLQQLKALLNSPLITPLLED